MTERERERGIVSPTMEIQLPLWWKVAVIQHCIATLPNWLRHENENGITYLLKNNGCTVQSYNFIKELTISLKFPGVVYDP